MMLFFFFQAEDGIRDGHVTGVQTCALPISVTEVEIDGVLHEYSDIEGVREDVIEILLNLKNLAVVMHGKDQAVLTLSKKGPGAVTAGDIQLDHDIEIKNPELVIAIITDKTEVNMCMYDIRGRGYM